MVKLGLKNIGKSLIFFWKKIEVQNSVKVTPWKKIETESFFESKNKMQRSHFLKGGEKTRRTLTSIKWHERKAKVVLLFSRSSKAAHDFGLNEIGTCQSQKKTMAFKPQLNGLETQPHNIQSPRELFSSHILTKTLC